MQFSQATLLSVLAAVAAATPLVDVRNISDSCVKQDDQCRSAADANLSTCASMLETCVNSCQAGLDSCNGSATTDKAQCLDAFQRCAGEGEEPATSAAAAAERRLRLRRNISDSCVKQDDQCRAVDGANLSTCTSMLETCVSSCQAGLDSCDGSATTDKAQCLDAFERCAGEGEEPATRRLRRNVSESCAKQDDECRAVDGANLSTCTSMLETCVNSCQAGLDSCNGSATTDKAQCAATFEKCAGE
ncbi:hypothetical protein GGR56DRAFT_204031 [Xylariaceae sp. FL0804]|nr:hypothetical protein GGR56DRAFT_204031 [Xylariaceae sp. FL0804]